MLQWSRPVTFDLDLDLPSWHRNTVSDTLLCPHWSQVRHNETMSENKFHNKWLFGFEPAAAEPHYDSWKSLCYCLTRVLRLQSGCYSDWWKQPVIDQSLKGDCSVDDPLLLFLFLFQPLPSLWWLLCSSSSSSLFLLCGDCSSGCCSEVKTP